MGESGWTLAQATKAKFPEVADGVGSALLGCVSLGLAMADIGFGVQHDANHGGYSERRAINRLLALNVRAALGSHVRWLKRMGQPLAVEAL